MVKAGYVSEEGRTVTRNNLGVPQGGIISPVLSNIYLHEFDKFMEKLCQKYSDFSKRVSRHNPLYNKLKKEENLVILSKTPSMVRDKTTGTRV
jgi:retron-type reverse transcriptase